MSTPEISDETAKCGKPLHKACACVRPLEHDGPCNCTYPNGTPEEKA